jgi:flagellar biosynthetic protein FliQ
MNIEQAIEILRQLVTLSLMLVAPFLISSMVIGVLVSLFQAVTSIQEQTLSFMPKLLAMGLVLMLSAPWLLRTMMQFTIMILSRLPEMTK